MGSVTIRVETTSYVSSMYVKISGQLLRGSKVHFIHIFFYEKRCVHIFILNPGSSHHDHEFKNESTVNRRVKTFDG